MDYVTLKWIHILSSTILFGTGLGSAFYLFMAHRTRDVGGIYVTVRHVVIADWIFTTPSVVIQLMTGVALARKAGYPLSEGWPLMALGLYGFAGACWLPVVRMQILMRDMAKQAHASAAPLPERYWRMARLWVMLGCLAFPAVVVVFWLMVFKPEF